MAQAGCGMIEILMERCRMQIIRQERHLLILIGGMWDSFEIDDEM